VAHFTEPGECPAGRADHLLESNRLYDAMDAVTAIWTEARTGSDQVIVVGGRFNVSLGSVSAFANAGLDFCHTYYLEIQVGTDEPFAPRLAFSAVPYAMRAAAVVEGAVTDATLAAPPRPLQQTRLQMVPRCHRRSAVSVLK